MMIMRMMAFETSPFYLFFLWVILRHTVGPNTFPSPVWNSLHATHLATRILRGLLDLFGNLSTPDSDYIASNVRVIV